MARVSRPNKLAIWLFMASKWAGDGHRVRDNLTGLELWKMDIVSMQFLDFVPRKPQIFNP